MKLLINCFGIDDVFPCYIVDAHVVLLLILYFLDMKPFGFFFRKNVVLIFCLVLL